MLFSQHLVLAPAAVHILQASLLQGLQVVVQLQLHHHPRLEELVRDEVHHPLPVEVEEVVGHHQLLLGRKSDLLQEVQVVDHQALVKRPHQP